MQIYSAIRKELAEGGRTYIICPLVEESSAEIMADVRAAEEEHRRLQQDGVLGGAECGLLHGRLSSEEKIAALHAFATGQTPVLISTTVVEVSTAFSPTWHGQQVHFLSFYGQFAAWCKVRHRLHSLRRCKPLLVADLSAGPRHALCRLVSHIDSSHVASTCDAVSLLQNFRNFIKLHKQPFCAVTNLVLQAPGMYTL